VTIDTSSHSYLLGVAEYERDKFRSALERIVLLAPHSESRRSLAWAISPAKRLLYKMPIVTADDATMKLHAKLEIDASATQTSAK
jgi:hypothetical protein